MLEGCATGSWGSISSRRGGRGEILPRASVVAAPWQIQPGAGALLCQPWEEEQQCCSEPTDPIEKVRRVAEAGHGVQQVATRPVRVASSAAGSLPVPPQPGGACRDRGGECTARNSPCSTEEHGPTWGSWSQCQTHLGLLCALLRSFLGLFSYADPQNAETGRKVRAESKQEKGRFSSFLFLTLQTTLVSLYLGKKVFRAFPASPFSTFSYFLADVSRGQGSEAGGARLGSHPADEPWERKFGSKQVPVVLHGQRRTVRPWRMCPCASRSCVTMQNL